MEALAATAGVSVPALKLLLSVLAGYPLSILYRLLPKSSPVELKTPEWFLAKQWMLSLFSGVAITIFCYDVQAVHFLATVFFTWLFLAVLPRRLVAPVVFSFNMAYLLIAYYVQSTEHDYDIDFTMAQCVLTLRLIGLGFDYSDGGLPEEKLSGYQKQHALRTLPSLLETLAFSYHWAGLMVGPQYSLATYRRFLLGQLGGPDAQKRPMPSALWPALQTLVLGLIYLGVNVVGSAHFPTEALLTEEFRMSWPLWKRIGWMWIAFRVLLVRYGGIWLLTDGHCILSGLGYNGRDANGRPQWDNVSNFYPGRFETATSIADYVNAFNVNTNAWVKEYVFKRLRFLNDKNLSFLGSLVFLAIWHGFAPGYFLTFGMEFIDSFGESALVRLAKPITDRANHSAPLRVLVTATSWVLASLMISHGLVAFPVKQLGKAVQSYQGLYWLGHAVPVLFILLDAIAGLFRRPKASKAKAQ